MPFRWDDPRCPRYLLVRETVTSVAFLRAPYNLYSDAPRNNVTPFADKSRYPLEVVVALGADVVVAPGVVVEVVVEVGSVNFGVIDTGRIGWATR